MRAIKREKMDVKVLDRMNKMLVASAAEQKLDAQEEKLKQHKLKKLKGGDAEETIEAPPAELPTIESPSGNTWKSKKFHVEFIYLILQFVESDEDSMDVEGDSESVTGGTSRKLRKPNTKTMRNEKNQFPVWMSSKKIKYHKRLTKKSAKRNTKEAKKTKQWKRACSL